jgi:CheY-like chemotaxis protein
MDGPERRNDGPGPRMRVLIVDDHEDSARSVRALLRPRGYEVKLAFDGREAIEVAQSFRPDVLLLDLTLPDMSGAEVAEELRKALGFEGTAIVAVTGFGSDRVPADFDGHFVKPVDHDALCRFLARLAAEGKRPGDDGTPHAPPRPGP